MTDTRKISKISIILRIFSCILIIAFIVHIWTDSNQYPSKIPYYHYQYQISVNTNQSGEYEIILPIVIQADSLDGVEYIKKESGERPYIRMNELRLTKGSSDTRFEIVNTSKGYGLLISASGNISLELNISGVDDNYFHEGQKLMLSTTENNTIIVGPYYRGWLFFNNSSEVDYINIELIFHINCFNRWDSVDISAELNSKGWTLVSGEPYH